MGTSINFYLSTVQETGSDLCQLKLKRNHLPSNIQIRDGNPDTDELLIDTSILLLLSTWHESGSRLIHEGHQRGIPVLAFATGGTPELMAHTPVDLFEPPEQSGNWDPSPILQRINTLLSDSDQYALHSRALIKTIQGIEASNQSKPSSQSSHHSKGCSTSTQVTIQGFRGLKQIQVLIDPLNALRRLEN